MLQGMGYKPHVAAGLVGNLMQESGWDINTGAVGDNGNSFGAVQWNGPRRRAFKAWAAQNGFPEAGLGTQIAYLDHEMKTSERGAYDALQNVKDVRSAALTGSRKFWRPGTPHNKNRMKYAQAVLTDAIQTGAISGGGGSDTLAGGDMLQQPVMRGNLEPSPDMMQRGPSRGTITSDMVAQAGGVTFDDLDEMVDRAENQGRGVPVQQEPQSTPSGSVTFDELDALVANAEQRVQGSEPSFAERALGAVGDAASAVGGYVVDSAEAFANNAGRAFGSAVNEYISGGQGVDPTAVDLSQGIGFLEQEIGGEPYVLIPGLDGSPDRKVPVTEFSGRDYITQVDPQSGRTVVLPRTPETAETSPVLNAGRMLGLPTATTAPMGSTGVASAGTSATGAAAQAARAAQRLDVTPSFGMGGAMPGRIASVGSDSAITAGRFVDDSARVVDEIAGAREGVAATVGGGTEAVHAGEALVKGANNFLDVHMRGGSRGPNSRSVAEILFENVGKHIPGDTMIDVQNTAKALDGFLSQFPNLQNVAKDLGIDKWRGWVDDITASGGQLQWKEVSALRSMIGEAIGKMSGPMANKSQGQIKQIYGALSEDLGTAARQAGPDATRAWQRAQDHYSKVSKTRDEALDLIFKAEGQPEKVYNNLYALGTDKGRANIGKLREIRNAMPAEAWQTVVSTVIRRMGTQGDDFSPAKFVTEWQKLSKPAKEVLFSGRKVPAGLRKAMDDLVMVADSSKGAEALLNRSRSGQNAINFTTGLGAGAAALTGDIVNIAIALGIGAGARITAVGMTNTAFLRALRAYIGSGGSVGASKRLASVVASTRKSWLCRWQDLGMARPTKGRPNYRNEPKNLNGGYPIAV